MCNVISQKNAGKIFGIGEERAISLTRRGHFDGLKIYDKGRFVGLDLVKLLEKKEQLKYYADKTCIECNAQISIKRPIRAKHCSNKCSGKYDVRNCDQCGAAYKSENYGSKYCSNSCRAKATTHNLNCTVCNTIYQSRMPNAKYCSKSCWHAQLKANQASKPKELNQRECGFCSQLFVSDGRTKYCSNPCAKKAHNLKRKASDVVTFMALFERDLFRCVYCGLSSIVDGVKLSGDHIIPISKAGKHDINNIVTCCSTCNSAKNNKLLPDVVIKELLTVVAERNKQLSHEQRASLVNIERVIAGYNRPSTRGKGGGLGV